MKALYLDLSSKSNVEHPALILSQRAFKKIHYWTHRAGEKRQECSGIGVIQHRKSLGDYYVSDVWLIRPTVVGNFYVEMDPQAVMELMMDLYNKGRRMSTMRFHWHSHERHPVGWSSTDEQTSRREFCTDADWTISLVVNMQGNHLARMDFPASQEEPLHNLPVRLEVPLYSPMRKNLEDIFLKNSIPSNVEMPKHNGVASRQHALPYAKLRGKR